MLVNNRRLHIELHGPADAPVVILLHHGLGSERAWRAQVPALAEAGWRVLAYDRWGYGQSDPRPGLSLPTFEDDVKDLRSILDGLEIFRAALVGHSDGGTIALYFASQYLSRVTRLATVAAHIYVEPKMEPGMESLRRMYVSDETFRRALQRVHGDKADAVFWNWHDGWRRPEHLEWDMRPILAQVACPALVVQGQEDEYATPRHAEDLAKALPNAELRLLPGAKHMLPQENSQLFNQRLLAFLGEPGNAEP